MSIFLKGRVVISLGKRYFADVVSKSSVEKVGKKISETVVKAEEKPKVVVKEVTKVVEKTPFNRKRNWFITGFVLTAGTMGYYVNSLIDKKNNQIETAISLLRVDLKEKNYEFEQRLLRLENAKNN
ncbi:hypothetical protein WA158_005229 [Blastocystis sp. Blastoise]